MARPRTYFELNRLAEIAKKREAAREAAKLAATPAAYKAKDPATVRYFRSIESDKLYVKMPISKVAWDAVGEQATAIGALDAAAVAAISGSSTVNFEGNNDEVLRIRVHSLKATPTVKVTAWGTRVVDKIDSSLSFPFGVTGADNSLAKAKSDFQALMVGNGVLGSRAGNYAELLYRGKIISKYVKPSA